MLSKNIDKITAFASVVVFAVALILCVSVTLDEGKDAVARITALAGLCFSSMTLVLKVWDSMEKIDCTPKRYDHDVGNYFAVEVYNRGSVPVQVKDVELRCGGNRKFSAFQFAS